jgi:hypothetical protein
MSASGQSDPLRMNTRQPLAAYSQVFVVQQQVVSGPAAQHTQADNHRCVCRKKVIQTVLLFSYRTSATYSEAIASYNYPHCYCMDLIFHLVAPCRQQRDATVGAYYICRLITQGYN